MIVIPSSDLRNRYTEVTDRYLDSGEPIYLTKNGYGHAVLISIKQYEKLVKDDLAARIDEGMKEAAEGKGMAIDDAIDSLKKDLGL